MSIITKGPKENINEEQNQEPQMLTPWQKENLKFLQEKGDQPKWAIGRQEVSKKKKKQLDKPDDPKEEPTSDEKVVKELPRSSSFADKLPKLKKARQKKLARRLTFIIGSFGIAMIFMMYYISPYSKLGKVEVVGSKLVPQAEIVKQSKFAMGEGLWQQYFKRGNGARAIEKAIPRVKKASVTLKNVNQFVITVKEYQTVGLAVEGDKYHPILENGVILKDFAEKQGTGEAVFKNFTNGQPIVDLVTAYKNLAPEIKENIAEIAGTPSASNKHLITLKMKDGNQVIASTVDFGEKMIYYPKVASEMIENGIIDMEAGIFSYPYGNNDEKKEENTENSEN